MHAEMLQERLRGRARPEAPGGGGDGDEGHPGDDDGEERPPHGPQPLPGDQADRALEAERDVAGDE